MVTIVQWCKGIAFSFHWVKDHVDLIYLPMTIDERQNIEADLQADVVRAQARGAITASPNCAQWDIEEASLSIGGSKITSDKKTQLTSQMHDYNLHTFLSKETWSPHTFNSID
jgi:hypothetical protein